MNARDWFERGNELKRAGNVAGALDAFRQSIKLNRRTAAPWVGLAQVLEANGQLQDARECLTRATTVDPKHLVSRLQLASAHKKLGHVDDARREYEIALEIDPSSAAAHFGLGQVMEDLGNPGAAAAAYRSASRLEPSRPEALANLLGLGGHIDIAAEMDEARRRLTCGDRRDRALVGYGLGKALEQKGSHEDAFSAYAAANAARREATGAFDRDAFDRRVEAMIGIFSPGFFAARRSWGERSERPVLIVGLPRSGTTLTEQVIASHPECFGAGELDVLTDLATGLPDRLARSDPPWPDCATDLDETQAGAIGRDYLAQSGLRAPGTALRVVDKQPLNFWHLGLVAAVLPNARIIHCTRDIRDCGFSIFAHNFNVQLKWATDLGDIAHFWRGYRRLMAHWASVTGLRTIEAAYEDTVSDLESQARRLLAFIGLPWDARVLAFHENERAVQTPSRWQVRQPLYTSSNARWRHYENRLGPLMEAAGTLSSRTEIAPGCQPK